jgi:hypothetical protein
MPKRKSSIRKARAPEQDLKKWACSLFGDRSEIDVFVESEKCWRTVAEVRSTDTYDAEEIASFIVQTMNDRRIFAIHQETKEAKE